MERLVTEATSSDLKATVESLHKCVAAFVYDIAVIVSASEPIAK